jgi:hypothetical protein
MYNSGRCNSGKAIAVGWLGFHRRSMDCHDKTSKPSKPRLVSKRLLDQQCLAASIHAPQPTNGAGPSPLSGVHPLARAAAPQGGDRIWLFQPSPSKRGTERAKRAQGESHRDVRRNLVTISSQRPSVDSRRARGQGGEGPRGDAAAQPRRAHAPSTRTLARVLDGRSRDWSSRCRDARRLGGEVFRRRPRAGPARSSSPSRASGWREAST